MNSLNNNNYFHDNRNSFWSKHCVVVAIDVSEILDRVFCKCGLINSFQEAYTLTALDRRVFAPPIENKEWQRVVNMANTCETFHFAPTYVAHLFHRGFKSVTLLSMAENLSKKNPMAAQHNKCLSVLNDRRVTPLEPLHSLRRLLQAKRKQAFKLKHVDYLDLANVSPKKQKLPPNRDYRLHQPMIAKSTFNNFDTISLLGPKPHCNCSWDLDNEESESSEEVVFIKGQPVLRHCSTSSSSGYSSASSSHGVPDSPDPVKKPEPLLIQTQNYYGKPRGNYQGNFRKYSLPPIDNSKVFCPRPDCNWRLFPSQVENHCTNFHHINKTVSVFTYTELRQYINDNRTLKKLCGDVKLTLNTKEILEENRIQLWWGPVPFFFDNVIFYLLVYKKVDQESPKSEPQIMFWIWTPLPKKEASWYRYEIHLENPGQNRYNNHRHPFLGNVQSLEFCPSELLGGHHHLKSAVFFKVGYIRKTLRFTHNHHQPPPRTLDMNYTVKIMRQS